MGSTLSATRSEQSASSRFPSCHFPQPTLLRWSRTNLQPTYDVIPSKLQLVGRYALSTGDGAQSVSPQKRCEAEAPSLAAGGKGETYQSAYLGLQYFIHGDRCKVLAGVEYSHLSGGSGSSGKDFDGPTFLTGVRLYFCSDGIQAFPL